MATYEMNPEQYAEFRSRTAPPGREKGGYGVSDDLGAAERDVSELYVIPLKEGRILDVKNASGRVKVYFEEDGNPSRYVLTTEDEKLEKAARRSGAVDRERGYFGFRGEEASDEGKNAANEPGRSYTEPPQLTQNAPKKVEGKAFEKTKDVNSMLNLEPQKDSKVVEMTPGQFRDFLPNWPDVKLVYDGAAHSGYAQGYLVRDSPGASGPEQVGTVKIYYGKDGKPERYVMETNDWDLVASAKGSKAAPAPFRLLDEAIRPRAMTEQEVVFIDLAKLEKMNAALEQWEGTGPFSAKEKERKDIVHKAIQDAKKEKNSVAKVPLEAMPRLVKAAEISERAENKGAVAGAPKTKKQAA